MDVGATSLDKGTDRIVESSATQSDTKMQHTRSLLQESDVTSRLSSLLSSLVAEPLAAASKMPQHQTPQNISVGEKTSLPQPLTTPRFPIPPHMMGRTVNNPVEDPVAHGRRLQKPRLGVKVPYRNLTSQIVTQDELAQELLERSLKKHPVRDVPKGGDLFFAIKLAQRLANRLSPGNAHVASASQSQSPGRSSQQNSPEDKRSVTSKRSLSGETPAIADNKDLLAILEGDGDSDWVPKPPTSATSSTKQHVSLPSIPQITRVKLDPILEKELALKQLMEFQNSSRRRKADKGQKSGETRTPGGQKHQGEKQPLNKENGSLNRKVKQVIVTGSQKTNRSVSLVNSSDSNNTPSQRVSLKDTRKRKRDTSSSRDVKKPRIMGRRVQKQNPTVKNKEETQKKNSKTPSPSSNNNNIAEPSVSASSLNKAKSVSNVKIAKSTNENKPKISKSPFEKIHSVDSVKKIISGVSGNQISSSNEEIGVSVRKSNSPSGNSSTRNSSVDDFPEFPQSFPTPIRTYSPKKRTSTSAVSQKIPESHSVGEVVTVKEEKITQETEITGVIKETSPIASNLSSENIQKKKDSITKESIDNKRRRMGEVDRLLMDEGAINLLYEAERGESRRRSNITEEHESAPIPQRKVLKSVRRKKKDLLLKTRLVKNAVLRLTSSPCVTVSSAPGRITRQTETPTLLSKSLDQSSGQLRKLSLDSRESVGSPPPLTPNDPPSPQSFIYPTRLPIPAEASRIIRRHSSSSNFSSRSASPNNVRLSDTTQKTENLEKSLDRQQKGSITKACENVKSSGLSSGGRKKGVPIFVRKPQVIYTYEGKRKRNLSFDRKGSISNVISKQTNKNSYQHKDQKTATKTQSVTAQKITSEKRKGAVKPMNMTEKMIVKAEMAKSFQKGLHTGKMSLKKTVENINGKAKKKDEGIKEKSTKSAVPSNSSSNGNGSIVDEMLDLTSCLAAAASAFAAEAQEVRDEKASKKSSSSSGTSHTSSPCPSRSSKSPTPTNRTTGKKGVLPPLSPNAATYSNLLKTLENDSQKPRKKDGDEVIKQRSSVRQNVAAYHYKDISLRRYENLVQIILTPQSTKMKNAINLQVLRELKDALCQLKKDETCRVVLLTSTGSSFCQGIDFYSLLHTNAERRKSAAQELAQALKEFMKSLALFSKPIVAGVHGPAVGLGVTMLPFFDMVFASDKATFYTPYAKLGQVPEGAAILTLPHMFGNAVTSELLFGCRKLTANEALHFGLVTRILWPDRFQEELIPVIRSMASQSSQSMEATKALLRHNVRTKLEAALESETHLLVQHWISAECQASFKKFLDDEDVGLQKQKVET